MPRTSSYDPDRVQLPTVEHVKGKAADKLLEHAWPVLAWVLLLPAGWILHANWPGPRPAGLLVLCGAGVSVLSVKISHTRGLVTKIMTPVTVTCAFAWLTAADMAGVSHAMTGVWFISGGAVVTGWALHTHHHATAGGVAISLEQATARAGFRGIKVLSMFLGDRKTSGSVKLPGGRVTVDEIAKEVRRVEGAAQLPPGALQITDDLDNAGRAKFTLTDPRVLRKGRDWPGPSRPGQSIAEPIRPGFWQDGEDVQYRIVGHHCQVMGMTGAGKSTGQGWNEIAEAITRFDHAEFGVDVTKGLQFLGPLEPALHGLVTEKEQVPEFFADVHACVKARADFLYETAHTTKWFEGCGLTHLGFQLEEVPDIVKLFGDDGDDLFDDWMSDVKAFRSAGGRWKPSLQRSDFTQIPTIVRGQMAKWCFGVESSGDADFGLSEYQKNKGCDPEMWTTTYPGQAFLDAGSIPQKYKTMPMRCFYWGEDTGPGSLIARHAAAYPAASRPLDPVTEKHLGKWLPAAARALVGKVPVMPGCPGGPRPDGPGGGQPRQDREVISITRHPAYKPEPGPPHQQEAPMHASSIWDDDEPAGDGDPLEAVMAADLEAPVDGITFEYDDTSDAARFTGDDGPEPPVLTAEQVQAAFDARVEELLDAQGTFDIGDIIGLAEEVGRSRPTLYRLLDLAVTTRKLRKTEKDGLTAWTRPRRPVSAGVSAGTDS